MVVLVCRSAKVAPTAIVREHLYRAAHTPSPPPPNHCCPSFPTTPLPRPHVVHPFPPAVLKPILLKMVIMINEGMLSAHTFCGVSPPLSTIISMCRPRAPSPADVICEQPTKYPYQYERFIHLIEPWDLTGYVIYNFPFFFI